MNKETFKDQKGTFHYEPVVWGDWKEGDVVVFDGYLSKTYYDYTLGESYTVGWEGGDLGPLDNDGYTPPTHWDNKSVFKFSRKVYDVVESVDKLRSCSTSILTLDDAILHAEDKYKELKSENQYLCADNHRMLALWLSDYKTKLQEENINQKDTKSLDNLLKELHNLKQEENELSVKVDNILKEINSVMKEHGLAIVFVENQ